MDILMVQIMQTSSPILFNLTSKNLGEQYDLPLLNIHTIENNYFGMFDIVQYYNKKIADPSDNDLIQNKDPTVLNSNHMNCVPHTDPGLLSLSILSTVEGLELEDPSSHLWLILSNVI
jgi:hypothetical protein